MRPDLEKAEKEKLEELGTEITAEATDLEITIREGRYQSIVIKTKYILKTGM